MGLSGNLLEYIESNADYAVDLLKELAVIPSPSNHEEKRAGFCKAWLEEQGAEGVFIDEALNVIYPVNCTDDNPLIVFMAHSDVVFPDTTTLPLHEENGRIYCPGIGDDTANAVVILMAAKYIAENRIIPKDYGMLLVINSGEEGLGNLKGSRKIVETYGHRIVRFHSFDGCNCNVTNGAVGSMRYKVEILTEGGHSYAKFGNRNAIQYMASLIDALYMVKVPQDGKTTYNVGVISGGTSVNTIAQQCEMLYEIRSDKKDNLDLMVRHFMSAVDFFRTKGVAVNVELVGERPCGGDVDPKAQEALDGKAREAILRYFNQDAIFGYASTDCNIPLSIGIPSIGVGCYIGDGMHTREEYVERDSLVPGMKLGFDLIFDYFGI